MTSLSAAEALFQCFDRVLVINLPERSDRRRSIETELARIGLSFDDPRVEIFSAVRPADAAGFPTIGAHGAFRSHLGVMERMLEQGWQRVLVLEDDMGLAPGAEARLPGLLQALAARLWGLVYGHAGDDPGAHPTADSDGLLTLPNRLNLIQLHFLGIDRAAAAVIVPELRAMMTRPTGSPDGGPMHVDGALNWIRYDREDLIALAIDPPIAIQKSSRSDIAPLRWFDRWPVVRTIVALLRRLRSG